MTELETAVVEWLRTENPTAKQNKYHDMKRKGIDLWRTCLGASKQSSPADESEQDSAPAYDPWQSVFDGVYHQFTQMGLSCEDAAHAAERETDRIFEHLGERKAA